jgi:hypothetical protein
MRSVFAAHPAPADAVAAFSELDGKPTGQLAKSSEHAHTSLSLLSAPNPAGLAGFWQPPTTDVRTAQPSQNALDSHQSGSAAHFSSLNGKDGPGQQHNPKGIPHPLSPATSSPDLGHLSLAHAKGPRPGAYQNGEADVYNKGPAGGDEDVQAMADLIPEPPEVR